MPYYYYSFLSKMHFWTLCGLLAASTPPGREKSKNAPWRQNGLFLLQFLIKNAFLDALRPSGGLRPARAGKIGKRLPPPEESIKIAYSATPNTPRNRKCLILPHQTHR